MIAMRDAMMSESEVEWLERGLCDPAGYIETAYRHLEDDDLHIRDTRCMIHETYMRQNLDGFSVVAIVDAINMGGVRSNLATNDSS